MARGARVRIHSPQSRVSLHAFTHYSSTISLHKNFFKKFTHSLILITSATGMLASVLAAISIAGIGAGSCRGAAATFSACSLRITLIFSRSSFSCAGPEEHEARLGGAKRRSEAETASGRQGSASCLLVHEQFDVLREPRVRVSYQRLDLGDRIA